MDSREAGYLGRTHSRASDESATRAYKYLAVYVLSVGALVVAVADVLTYFRFVSGDLINAFIVAVFVLLIGAVLVLRVWIASLVAAIKALKRARPGDTPGKAHERAIANIALCVLALPCAPALWVVALVTLVDSLNRISL